MSKTIGLKLVSWQLDAAKIFSTLEHGDRLILISPRQVGKTLLITQFAFYAALNNPKSTSIIISPVNRQNMKIFSTMKSMCVNSYLTKSANESKLEIEFINGSKILFLSAEAGDNLRGNTVSKGGVLIVDEACYIKDSVWPVILPFVNVSRAPIILSSTPRFRSGLYYEWYCKAEMKKIHYKLVNASRYDLSFFRSQDIIEEYEKILPKAFFRSEILGEFMDDNDGVFGDFMSCVSEPDNYDIEYVGIDWSTTGIDSTQAVCFNNKRQMVKIISFNNEDPMALVDSLATTFKSCPKLKSILVEQNSIGEVYFSALKRAFKDQSILKKNYTSNNSKKEMVERVVEAFARKEITILDDAELLFQLRNYNIEMLSKGNYTYNAAPGAHDDMIIGLCLACKSFLTNSGKYNIW